MSKIRDGEGIYIVSSIVDGKKVKIIIPVKRTTSRSDKDNVSVKPHDYITPDFSHGTQHLRSRNTNYIPIYNDIILVVAVSCPLYKNNKFHFVSIENQ
ncbi:hypothetical protein H5410_045877 [Solanum commersonii]|uniref:Uncharacterized protein n=1 Tax=Solanum commersonii TaxID=4109 RepID=A0A9J5XAR7_SOLCO|nr:hypothetical protein H5410_045877 [Solanum commersonii]